MCSVAIFAIIRTQKLLNIRYDSMRKCEKKQKTMADYVKIGPILVCNYVKLVIFAYHY